MSDRGSQSKKTRANAERGTHVPRQPEGTRRRVSRAERDAKRQKQLRWGVGIAAVAVLAVLIGFATWDYVIKPRQVLATVDGTRIRREDYWKFRRLELYQQMSQYSQFSQMVSDQNQAQQYQSLALQAQAQFDTVWGSTDVNDTTLQQMIDNEIYVQSLEDFGLEVTDEEVETWTLNQFAPADAPLIEPTVTPTFVPERAAWVTQTAEALTPTVEITPTVTGGDSTPIGGATPITEATPITDSTPAVAASPLVDAPPAASPDVDPALVASPEASPMASPDAVIGSPGAESSPMASPEATPEPSPTLSQEQAVATAETGWDNYQSVLDQANMSVEDYYRLTARPQLAQQKIRDTLTADIGQTGDQVHARHILVATEELANQLYTDISSGTQDFATVAAQASTDTATAPNGGDLGWFPRGVMVDAFEEVAFSTPAGTVAAPVQSEFGWHIIEVLETQTGRALTDEQITQLQDSAVQDWLAEQRAEMSISSVMEPTPTPAAANFVPPVDAPPVPTATAFPEDVIDETTPEASPVAPSGTPEATPHVEPMASPIAGESSPVASQASSPVASPEPDASTPVVDASPEATQLAASPESSPMSTPDDITSAATAIASPADVVLAGNATPDASPTADEATPVASPDLIIGATPVASPVASTDATPTASPMSDVATPAATPDLAIGATPLASPVLSAAVGSATPIASPIPAVESTPAATPDATPIETETGAATAVVPGTTPAAVVTAATPAPVVETSCATPAASPIASPDASPEASPVASPFFVSDACAAP